jgi:3-dehydroquinate synthetase
VLEQLGRPTLLDAAWEDDALVRAMGRDKKVRSETLRFALPRAIGTMAGSDSNWTVPVSPEVARIVLTTSRSLATLY